MVYRSVLAVIDLFSTVNHRLINMIVFCSKPLGLCSFTVFNFFLHQIFIFYLTENWWSTETGPVFMKNKRFCHFCNPSICT
jgi:hypothetical protein